LISAELEEMAYHLQKSSQEKLETSGPEMDDGSINILDKVIAMIFDRLPSVTPIESSQERFQNLARRHWIIKNLWLNEFGKLPP